MPAHQQGAALVTKLLRFVKLFEIPSCAHLCFISTKSGWSQTGNLIQENRESACEWWGRGLVKLDCPCRWLLPYIDMARGTVDTGTGWSLDTPPGPWWHNDACHRDRDGKWGIKSEKSGPDCQTCVLRADWLSTLELFGIRPQWIWLAKSDSLVCQAILKLVKLSLARRSGTSINKLERSDANRGHCPRLKSEQKLDNAQWPSARNEHLTTVVCRSHTSLWSHRFVLNLWNVKKYVFCGWLTGSQDPRWLHQRRAHGQGNQGEWEAWFKPISWFKPVFLLINKLMLGVEIVVHLFIVTSKIYSTYTYALLIFSTYLSICMLNI